MFQRILAKPSHGSIANQEAKEMLSSKNELIEINRLKGAENAKIDQTILLEFSDPTSPYGMLFVSEYLDALTDLCLSKTSLLCLIFET